MSSSASSAGTRPSWARQQLQHLKIKPEEALLGGRTSGALWIVDGLTLALYPLLPGVGHVNVRVTETIAGLGAVWGLIAWQFVRWRWVSPLLLQFTTLLAYPTIAVIVAVTGESHSNCWIYLWFVGYFGFYFYRRPVALVYLALCVIVQALPLAYDPRALHDGYLGVVIIAAGAYAVVGSAIIVAKERFDALRSREQIRAAQQQALQRAATAAVGGANPDEVYKVVAHEATLLLGGNGAAVCKLNGQLELTVMSSWSDGNWPELRTGTNIPILPWGTFDRARSEGRAIVDLNPRPGTFGLDAGLTGVVIAPVLIGGEVWGGLLVATREPFGFRGANLAENAATFGALLGEIVTSLQDRERLAAEALTDPLTSLANRSQLDQRLGIDLAAATRHGRILTVAMIDLDHFKEINDLLGHGAGDAALKGVAQALDRVKRLEDTVGRFGGDEFLWIMPDTSASQALNALERARDLIARTVEAPRGATSSAGVCDTSVTSDAAELVHCADVALYASKQAGRNTVTIYEDTMDSKVASGRDQWHERTQALDGLRALARAIDAKDPATRQHSERVATFVGHLANAAGWSEDRVARLREAALVHDVGKLGVPDAILTKPERLTELERQQMNEHVELSARIVGSVLTDEQVRWIRAHHERPDGRGYPAGLTQDDIPEGAGLIALADSWDVMTMGRAYNRRKSVEEAYNECLELKGRQFMPVAVNALKTLRKSGRLDFDSTGAVIVFEEPGGSVREPVVAEHAGAQARSV